MNGEYFGLGISDFESLPKVIGIVKQKDSGSLRFVHEFLIHLSLLDRFLIADK